MHNTYGALKYQLKFFSTLTVIWLMVVILNLIVAISVILLFPKAHGSGSDLVVGQIDAQTYIWTFILGLLCFKTSFKFMLANGFSRKRFYWANLGALAVTMASWTGIVLLLAVVFKSFEHYKLLHELMYTGATGGVLWMLAAFFLLAILGWSISMVYYRSDNQRKVLVSVAPFVLSALLAFIDTRIGGAISRALGRFFSAAMGFSTATPNPYIGALSMLLLAAFLCGCNFLLIRRAQIKD